MSNNIYYDPLIQRISQAARAELRNSDDGLAVVTVNVLIGKDGRPLHWAIPSCCKIEPSNRAQELLMMLGAQPAGAL